MTAMSMNNRSDEHHDAASGRNGPNVALVVAGAVLVFFIIWVLRNGKHVSVDFMLLNWDTTVRWLIFVVFVLGILFDRLVGWWWQRRRDKRD